MHVVPKRNRQVFGLLRSIRDIGPPFKVVPRRTSRRDIRCGCREDWSSHLYDIRRLTMRTATGARRLETAEDAQTERRWRLGFFIALSCAVLLALATFAQEPSATPLIRP